MSSAIRFFAIEDLMHRLELQTLLHVESDNLLFGRVTHQAVPSLKHSYPYLAATILSGDMITASILWIGCRDAIIDFNDFLTSKASFILIFLFHTPRK
jgi:hypothetical protein